MPSNPTSIGIACPSCGHRCSSVIDSRPTDHFVIPTTRRRRECGGCRARFTTFEISEGYLEDQIKTRLKQVGLKLIMQALT